MFDFKAKDKEKVEREKERKKKRWYSKNSKKKDKKESVVEQQPKEVHIETTLTEETPVLPPESNKIIVEPITIKPIEKKLPIPKKTTSPKKAAGSSSLLFIIIIFTSPFHALSSSYFLRSFTITQAHNFISQ